MDCCVHLLLPHLNLAIGVVFLPPLINNNNNNRQKNLDLSFHLAPICAFKHLLVFKMASGLPLHLKYSIEKWRLRPKTTSSYCMVWHMAYFALSFVVTVPTVLGFLEWRSHIRVYGIKPTFARIPQTVKQTWPDNELSNNLQIWISKEWRQF